MTSRPVLKHVGLTIMSLCCKCTIFSFLHVRLILGQFLRLCISSENLQCRSKVNSCSIKSSKNWICNILGCHSVSFFNKRQVFLLSGFQQQAGPSCQFWREKIAELLNILSSCRMSPLHVCGLSSPVLEILLDECEKYILGTRTSSPEL